MLPRASRSLQQHARVSWADDGRKAAICGLNAREEPVEIVCFPRVVPASAELSRGVKHTAKAIGG